MNVSEFESLCAESEIRYGVNTDLVFIDHGENQSWRWRGEERFRLFGEESGLSTKRAQVLAKKRATRVRKVLDDIKGGQ